jgi:ApbE superfamily uncharacterized protein (UPF0280 family)
VNASVIPAFPRAEQSATGAMRAPLAGGRWHFQHGPIDLVLQAWGDAGECARAYEQAWARFVTVLPELVSELPDLKKPVVPAQAGTHADASTVLRARAPSGVEMGPRFRGDDKFGCALDGAVARRMWRACAPLAEAFITPMAAVAGAVADEVMSAMIAGRALKKAYINNGGDIALHLAAGERLETGIVGDIAKPKITARASVAAGDAVRGIATSGWRGRSFSRGIADSVTVLARDAAGADAAATLIANAVNVDHPAIARRAARDLDPDSDLGEHLVTVAVGVLDFDALAVALARGRRAARDFQAKGLIEAAYIELQGRQIAVGADEPRRTAIGEKRMAWSLHA